jgi:hypothetical protein
MDADGTSTFDRALATEQIRRIILSYPELIDRGDLAGVGRLLDGVRFGSATGRNAPVIPPDQLTTRSAEDVEVVYRNAVIIYADGLPHTKHLISNVDIRFSDDRCSALSRSYYAVLQALEDFPLQLIIAGRYEDVFEATKDGWSLTIRREYADLIGDLHRHVKGAALQGSNSVGASGTAAPAGGV